MALDKATASSMTTSERSVAAVAERATEDVEAPIAAPARPRTDRRSSFDSLESTFSLFLFMLLFPSVADLSRSGLASLITAPLIDLVAHSNQRKNRPVFLLHLSYPILRIVPQDRTLSAIGGQKVAGKRLVKIGIAACPQPARLTPPAEGRFLPLPAFYWRLRAFIWPRRRAEWLSRLGELPSCAIVKHGGDRHPSIGALAGVQGLAIGMIAPDEIAPAGRKLVERQGRA